MEAFPHCGLALRVIARIDEMVLINKLLTRIDEKKTTRRTPSY